MKLGILGTGMIDDNDMDKVNEMFDISLTVSEIMEKARKLTKVVFGCEEK